MQGGFLPRLVLRCAQIHHNINVDVTIARVTEAGHREPMFLLQAGREAKRSSKRPRGTTTSSFNLVNPVSRKA